jgi:hypothetical protein
MSAIAVSSDPIPGNHPPDELMVGPRRAEAVVPPAPSGTAPLDPWALRADFPIFARRFGPEQRQLAYLDSAATALKPAVVIETVASYYRDSGANVHRGIYAIAEEATAAYEGARVRVARFLGASSPREIVFVRNATEAINLVAHSWGRAQLRPGDLVVLSEMEHHANLVPLLFHLSGVIQPKRTSDGAGSPKRPLHPLPQNGVRAISVRDTRVASTRSFMTSMRRSPPLSSPIRSDFAKMTSVMSKSDQRLSQQLQPLPWRVGLTSSEPPPRERMKVASR